MNKFSVSMRAFYLLFAFSMRQMQTMAFTFMNTKTMSARRTSNTLSRTELCAVPSLIVFDLDNTLWTPELYQLRKLQRNNQIPVAHSDVKLFPAAWDIIQKIRNDPDDTFANTKFAVASRTTSVEWAHDLLAQFELLDFFDFIEIFPGDKATHFDNLKKQSGVDYDGMLFFDDSRDGRFGNCEPVAKLGVLSVHCPKGIYEESIFYNALDHYKEWFTTHKSPNTIVEWDNSITTCTVDRNKRHSGVVKMVKDDKNFGFIRYCEKNPKDMFFHFSALPANQQVEEGDEVTFKITTDSRKGKDEAAEIVISNASTDEDTVNMHVFSMNLPFAALLSNGYKTLETRNGTMFTPYPEGTKMLLHVGQRIYPDGNRHIEVMKSGGLDETEIQSLKSLPRGFGKGMAVAIVELGKTFETTLEERCDPDFQRAVAAFGADSGMRTTEIKRVEYLKKGLKVSGNGGVFKANVPKGVIPEGWLGE